MKKRKRNSKNQQPLTIRYKFNETSQLNLKESLKIKSSTLYIGTNEVIKNAQKLSNKIESGENIILRDASKHLQSEIKKRKEINLKLTKIIKSLKDNLKRKRQAIKEVEKVIQEGNK